MKEKGYCYMVISAKDDLPLGVFDTFRELQNYLGVSHATLARMIIDRRCVRGLYVEKVLL